MNKKSIVKFSYRFVLLFIIIIILDAAIGESLSALFLKTKNPTISKMNYSFYNTGEKILIFGSSRGESHYIPKIIQDSTKLECFNTALGGQGIYYSYALLTETLSRYKPEMIVYDLSPNVILDPLALEKISFLLPYYNLNEEVQSIIELRSTFEKIKMFSSIYPYNSMLVSIITGLLKQDMGKPLLNGFVPVYGVLNPVEKKEMQNAEYKIDSNQINYFEKFISTCKKSNVPALVVVSPAYYKEENYKGVIEKFKEITIKYGQVFIDDSDFQGISENNNLFRDPLHLNETGAEMFSKEIAHKLKLQLKEFRQNIVER